MSLLAAATLITAWDPKAKPKAKPKARGTPAHAQETLRDAEKRLARLIRGAALRK